MKGKNPLRKAIALVAAIALAMSMVPAPALAVAADGVGQGRLLALDLGVQTGAWDGETLSEPASVGSTYQIGTGAELAWFAAQVNSGAGASYSAELTDDIDLGGKTWTPIGTSSSKGFGGTFDGKGFTVSGLLVENSWAQAGLFGNLTAGATLKNTVVAGEVKAENSAAGGLVSRADGAVRIENCGSEVDVTNAAKSGRAAGIVGWAYGAATIVGCFNRGDVTSGDRASGIVADTETTSTVSNCYNTGAISGSKANGIGVAGGITYANCYNAGSVTGTSTAYAIGASNYATYTNCHYLEGTAANALTANDAPSVQTASQMKSPAFVATLGAANWQVDAGAAVNGGFPLLAWEKVNAAQGIELAAPTGLSWLPAEPLKNEPFDMTYEMMQVAWQPVDGASGYVAKLYRADALEAASGTGDAATPVFTSGTLTDTTFDFFDAFAALDATDSARYVFTVTAKGDGTYYLDSPESAPDAAGFTFDGAAFVPAPTQTTWNEASKIAMWNRVDGATFYIVRLFRGSTLVAEYDLGENVIGTEGSTLSLKFISNMTASGDYFFTVRAGKVVQSGPNENKRAVSAQAVSSSTSYEAPEGETVEIASADDWMRIVNTTHEGTAYVTDADAQNVEWAKSYVITADLDFSNLSAEQLAQTKSWGNVDANFNGTLDGQGHKITGLTLSNGDNGLFNYIGARGTVKNLTVESANVLFNDNAGIFCVNNYGTISNCGVKNTNISSDYSGVIAGFVARNYGLVQDSYVEGGTLSTTTETGNGHAGFVGNNSGTVKRCWTSMDLQSGSFCEGGFCGWADERYDTERGEYVSAVFENCFALGSVSAAKGWSGGFVGRVNSSRATFTNCYAAGAVTSSAKPERAHGFFGSMGSEGPIDLGLTGAFNITLPAENVKNCFYCSDRTPRDNPANLAVGKTLAEMQADAFATSLGLDWERADGTNEGLPYLTDMAVPSPPETFPITVKVAIAHYDTDDYEFSQVGETVDVTLQSSGNSRVIDVMNAASEQGLIDFTYTTTVAYGSFVEAINGVKLSSPDGWMFTVNDDLSDVGVQLASVRNGDQLLWFQGMPANGFLPPAWQDVTGEAPNVSWVDIDTPAKLAALAGPDADMTASYRLTANIDMAGVDFAGIGSSDKPFSGTFRGKGYTISNLTVNRPNDHNVGMFNFVRGAEISNVTLRGASVTGRYSVGALVGVAAVTLDGSDKSKCVGNLIGRCNVSGTVTSVNDDVSATSDNAYAGGLVGFNDGDRDPKTGISVYSSIDRCTADVAVTAKASYAGGLVGGNYGTVTNCAARGAVAGGDCTGGLFGGNVGTVYDSSAAGAVSGGSRTGGFGGDNYNDAIERCYSTGNVVGAGEHIGGFVGDAGGTIRHCSSAGVVKAGAGDSYVGGFAGHYTGALTGLYVRITFEDNCGWCAPAAEGAAALPAIGNMKTSANESEQAVLDATRGLDWSAMRTRFDELHGVALPEGAPTIAPSEDPDPDPDPDPGTDEKPTAADVQALIDAIGVVALDADGSLPVAAKAAIDAARVAYDALPDEQKALVKNLGALETAEEMYAELEAAKEAGGSGSGAGASDSGSGSNAGGSGAAKDGGSGGAAGSGSSSKSGSGSSAGASGSSASKSSAKARDVNAITPAASVASAAKTSKKLAKPAAKKFKPTVKPAKKTLRVSFAKTKGALNYRVAYRKAGAKKWKFAWTGGKAAFNLKKLAKGGMYQYKVAAFAKRGGTWMRSAWSNVAYVWMQGSGLTLKAGKKSAKVTVRKLAKATGYRLAWSSKKSLSKAKTKKLVGAKKTKATLKKLASGKKTYVKVVPYKKYKGHVYVGAATIKTVKAR